ncbi:uncharacterized protein [Malus domestica]|uniref:uncharacterized protein isoform X10 n=1 Tax=Malus domestica TaxID=3750 RepID=UPI0010A9B38F|nr:uncharacterized protein LOC108170255 isoform X3 [Malus domestica]XP_028954016.1 uncharacterized protein LOC108170255 isoform X3 [Malus domestica]XP_028954017.1 uncharacterized protein LOC108170255 isoform X3 [Malus domestica]XP_028954018.1 uncharacterized protein LOC108170255 isoform X3 [Malus domestica]
MSLLVPINRTPSRNASPNSLASSPARDWVFRVCDFSLKPAKTCVFKEIRFFGFLTFLCSLRRPLYLRKSPILQKLWVSWRVLRLICFGFLTRDLRHHCYTKLADGVPLSQTRSLRGHTSFSRLHRIATSEHCTGLLNFEL